MFTILRNNFSWRVHDLIGFCYLFLLKQTKQPVWFIPYPALRHACFLSTRKIFHQVGYLWGTTLKSWSSTILEKIVAHPMQIITTIPPVYHRNRKWELFCSVKNRGSCFYHNPNLPPSISVRRSDKTSNNMLQINIALGEGVTFSPKIRQCVNIFFHDCNSIHIS